MSSLESVPAALQQLIVDHPLEFQVVGSSMEPILSPGERVRVEAQRWYWPGDVVAFAPAGSQSLVLHRVLGPVRTGGCWRLLTQGDARPGLDRPVPRSSVLGRAQRLSNSSPPSLTGPLDRLRSLLRYGWVIATMALRRIFS